MKAVLINWWSGVRESYWFVPSFMAVGAIVLSWITTAIDQSLGSEWLENSVWFYANKPAGARAVLATVAGSMIHLLKNPKYREYVLETGDWIGGRA